MAILDLAAVSAQAASERPERPAIEWGGALYAVRSFPEDWTPSMVETIRKEAQAIVDADNDDITQNLLRQTQALMFDKFPDDVIGNFTVAEFTSIWQWYMAQYPAINEAMRLAEQPQPKGRKRNANGRFSK